MKQNKKKKEEFEGIQEMIKESLQSTGLYQDEALTFGEYKKEIPQIFGRYDFDLAEFPLFRFYKHNLQKHDIREPLVYTDTIRGKDREVVERKWEVSAGRYGFGGASTHVLLYDLLQLYVEQGLDSDYIRFGTINALFMRRGDRNPAKSDYNRMLRDFKILEGYQFDCKNAFWHSKKKAYVDMSWRLFDNVCFFKAKHDSDQLQMPFGFVKINEVLKGIAQGRGFFALGFDNRLFYKLKPLEQRLAIHLAKRFRSSEVYIRFVDDIAHALPIEAKRTGNVRAILERAANGLLEKELPILESFKIEKSTKNGEWLVHFIRKNVPKDTLPVRRNSFDPDTAFLIEELIAASEEPQNRNWWQQCARSLGREGVFRAIGEFKEKSLLEDVRNKGGLLTSILKDIAEQYEVKIK